MGRGAPTGGQAVVALCGYSRVGKDTAAARLLSSGYQLGSTGERVAELLREINPCLTLADHQRVVTVDALFAELGYDGAKSLPAVRTLMQDTGSAIKGCQPDFFIRVVLEHHRATHPGAGLVIVGVRSAAEVTAVRTAGGVVLRIHRPGVGPMGGHQNDRDLDLVLADADIVNDATIEVLHDRVDDALVRLHRERGHRTILV
jgi:hypothetical protein